MEDNYPSLYRDKTTTRKVKGVVHVTAKLSTLVILVCIHLFRYETGDDNNNISTPLLLLIILKPNMISENWT